MHQVRNEEGQRDEHGSILSALFSSLSAPCAMVFFFLRIHMVGSPFSLVGPPFFLQLYVTWMGSLDVAGRLCGDLVAQETGKG